MITIEVQKDEITAALTGLSDGFADTTPLMQDIAQWLFVDATDRFSRERAPDGSIWAPRSQTTLDAYRRQGSPWGRILQKEGGLFGSLATEAGNGYASIFVNQPYAAVMQFGAKKGAFGKTRRGAPIPWGDIPARPFLGFEQPQIETITEIVTEWIEGLAK
jgi:phage virion morphogenesis protein